MQEKTEVTMQQQADLNDIASNPRAIIVSLCLLMGTCFPFLAADAVAAQGGERPNIQVILSDDMGY
jgi:hypothetical protein